MSKYSSAVKNTYKPDPSSNSVAVALPSVPVTEQHRPFTGWNVLKQSGVARANIAPTEARPDGTTEGGYAAQHTNKSVLQQHVAFFDLNGDGVITLLETFIAFRLLNFNLLLAAVSALFIHFGLSYATLPPWQLLPDPLMRIYVERIHRAKHGCDSGTYDNEGRYRPQLFADFFAKYGRKLDDGSGDWGMTFGQAMEGVWGQRLFMDWFGLTAASGEWFAAYVTIWPADGIMRMEDVRGVMDGSYLFKVAGDRRAAYDRKAAERKKQSMRKLN